jgi:hypothetical protein
VAIENPVGSAPAFYYEAGENIIISLPGVPREMEYILQNSVMPLLQEKFSLHGVIKARVLHTAGVGESLIDEAIGDLETSPNPTVGLLAHPGQVDVRITAKADTAQEAEQMIENIAQVARQRLGEAVFGVDGQTLEEIVSQKLSARGWRLFIIESGLSGELLKRLLPTNVASGEVKAGDCEIQQLEQQLQKMRQQRAGQVILYACLQSNGAQQSLALLLATPSEAISDRRLYGGHPANLSQWAVNTALDFLRRRL